MAKTLSAEKLRQIQSIMERDPQAYSEIEFGLLRHAQGQRREQLVTGRLLTQQQRENELLKNRLALAEKRLTTLARALHSVCEAAGRSLIDWESDRELAWIFGILRGWEELEDELADRFAWTPSQRELIQRYRAGLLEICQAE